MGCKLDITLGRTQATKLVVYGIFRDRSLIMGASGGGGG